MGMARSANGEMRNTYIFWLQNANCRKYLKDLDINERILLDLGEILLEFV